jgi:hypothetical protein
MKGMNMKFGTLLLVLSVFAFGGNAFALNCDQKITCTVNSSWDMTCTDGMNVGFCYEGSTFYACDCGIICNEAFDASGKIIWNCAPDNSN